jgi:hypothetical protein
MSHDIIDVESQVFDIKSLPKSQINDKDAHSDVEYEAEHAAAEGKTAAALQSLASAREAKSILALKKQVDTIAPNRRRSSDGTWGDDRHCGIPNPTSDHCPRVRDGRTGVVTAIDITNDPSNGCDVDKIAESIRAAKDARVKYIIWNHRICSSYDWRSTPAWTWRPYGGSNPHDKHIHVSVKSDKQSYDSQLAWDLSMLTS